MYACIHTYVISLLYDGIITFKNYQAMNIDNILEEDWE